MKDYTLAIEDGIVTSIELENAEAAESGMKMAICETQRGYYKAIGTLCREMQCFCQDGSQE